MKFDSIYDFLDNFKNNHVNYCYSNEGNIDFAKNLVLSCQNVKFPIVFFALDKPSFISLSPYCTVVKFWERNEFRLTITERLNSKSQDYDDNDFGSICWPCWEILKAILSKGLSATYLDTDIYVKKNFSEENFNLISQLKLDAIFQKNHMGKLCAGFFSVPAKSNIKFQNLFNENYLQKHNYYDFGSGADQAYLHKVLIPNNLLEINFFNYDLYPNGFNYYKNNDSIDSKARLIHFNCLKTKKEKIEKMKNYGYWLL